MLMDPCGIPRNLVKQKSTKGHQEHKKMLGAQIFYLLPIKTFFFFSANLKCFNSTDNVTVAQIDVEYFVNWLPEIKMEI